MDLIKGRDTLYEEYENLLLERDQLRKEAGQAWTAYLQQFGALITENYEEKVACIRCKKTISYCQYALNHGGKVDQAEMERYLEREMASYLDNLNRLLREKQEAENARSCSAYEAKRAKTLYYRLARLIHPDINPETDRSEKLQELWQRILIAYHCNDVKELAELEVLVRKTLKELGAEDVRAEIPDIGEKIEELREEIEKFRTTEPWTLRYLLENEKAAADRKKELTEELENYRSYHRELKEVLLRMMQSGGLQIHVE